MADDRKPQPREELNEGPDDGGPGQKHAEQVFGRAAEQQSRDDLRDRRGGATDAVTSPPPRRDGGIPEARTPHADTDPRRPEPDAVDSEPEGLKRPRKDPLSPTRGARGR
jgi:hypothetical protein